MKKIDVNTAKAIADLSKVVVEGYKVKAQVLNMVRNAENPNLLKSQIMQSGIITDEKLLLEKMKTKSNTRKQRAGLPIIYLR